MDCKSDVIGILVRRRDKDIATEETERRSPRGDRGRNQSDMAASQGLPKIVSSHWKGGERLTDLAVVPREKPHTGAAAREQPRDSPVIER